MERRIVGVIGAGKAGEDTLALAEEVGRAIAEAGCILICGGMGGVMEASARGAKAVGGTTVGILPGNHRQEANPFIDIPLITGFGEGRNIFIVRSAEVLIAISGGCGTLSEIALALRSGKTVIGLSTWDIPGVQKVSSPAEAVKKALAALSPL